MNILVTGSNGFIGSHLVDKLVNEGHNVVCVDNLSNGTKKYNNRGATYIYKDVNDNLSKIFNKGIDVVYHLASHINVRSSINHPGMDAQNNIMGTLNILDFCYKFNVKKIIFLSSGGAVYGDCKTIPIKEISEVDPQSPYALSKLTCEKYIEWYGRNKGLNYTILRLSNVFGPRQGAIGEGGVISIFSNLVNNNKELKIYGDGLQTRDFIYIDDAVSALLLSITYGDNDIINISSGKEITINNLALLFSKKVIYTDPIQGEVIRSCLDNNKANKVLRWSPKVKLTDGIKLTMRSLNE